jgi:hypothetical protein
LEVTNSVSLPIKNPNTTWYEADWMDHCMPRQSP